MFEPDPIRKYVETSPQEVFDIYNSINRSTIATPGRAPEPAQAFIASVYSQGAYEVFIYLYLAASNEGLLYHWSEGPVAGDDVPALYQSAFEFAEAMGFMMDDMHYRNKPAEEKTQTFNEVPMFHADISFMKGASDQAEDELLIESLEEEPALEEEVEEVDLNVLGAEHDVSPSSPSPGKSRQAEKAEEEDEISIDDSEVMLEAEPPPARPAWTKAAVPPPEAAEEDGLLDSLEEDGPSESSEEALEISLDDGQGEETMEGAPPASAVMEKEEIEVELDEPGEDLLTEEEEQALASAEDHAAEAGDEIEEIDFEEKKLAAPPPVKPVRARPAPPPEPEPEPEPARFEPPARTAKPAPAAMHSAPAGDSAPAGEATDDDYPILVSFLAMM